jgi:hypothetical protein
VFHRQHPVQASTHPLHVAAEYADNMIGTPDEKTAQEAFKTLFEQAETREVLLSWPNRDRDAELVSDPTDDGPNFQRLLSNVSRKHSSVNWPCKCLLCLRDQPIVYAALKADKKIGTRDESNTKEEFERLMRFYNMPEEEDWSSDAEKMEIERSLAESSKILQRMRQEKVRNTSDTLVNLFRKAPSAYNGYRAVKDKAVSAYNYGSTVLFPESTDEDDDAMIIHMVLLELIKFIH